MKCVDRGHDPERFYHCDCLEGGYNPHEAELDILRDIADAAEALNELGPDDDTWSAHERLRKAILARKRM